MKTLYFDCFAGASGNMILGALVDAGVSAADLRTELEKLNLAGFEMEIEKVDRSGISSSHVEIRVPDEKTHRHLPEIERIIGESSLSESVKARSIEIFRKLAESEASVHGIELSKVHFHEVGALDAIIDIVGTCIAFEMLGIEQFACSKIHVGSGFVNMAHGMFPVPPPAVASLLTGIPFYSTEIEGELITPTGAAIIASVCNGYGSIPEIKLEAVGYGAGTRTYQKFPNVLRVMIGWAEPLGAQAENERDDLVLLETNIDDLSPQILGHFMERALSEGALDCWFTAIQMKKNRPATLVSVLAKAADRETFLDMLYRETSTIGVRVQSVYRYALERRRREIETEFGHIAIKVASKDGEVLNSKAEFEDIRLAAEANGRTVKEVVDSVERSIAIEDRVSS